jgi:hypothetical protein
MEINHVRVEVQAPSHTHERESAPTRFFTALCCAESSAVPGKIAHCGAALFEPRQGYRTGDSRVLLDLRRGKRPVDPT